MSHWRNTFKPARFFMIDARASFFVLLFLLHMRVWTMIALFIVFGILLFVERMGYDFASALRALRSSMAGNLRNNKPRNKESFPVDYDRVHFKK